MLSIKRPPSVLPGQRHDGVRAHRDAATALQMSDEPGAAAPASFGTENAHGLAVELELRLRQQACPLADFSRNGPPDLWM
ncbi:MAG: hypothetical protein AB7I72_11340 [Parvibaculaceae bacterium]